jgi:hypothetical protein
MLTTPTTFYGRTGTLSQGAVRPVSEAPQASFWGSDGFGFGDVLDIINPLQHIPIVSDMYRSATGDEQAPGSKVAGGALFGGIGGLLAGFMTSSLEQLTGRNFIQNMAGILDGEKAKIQTAAANANNENAEGGALKVDWSGERYDTASFLRRYQTAQYLGLPQNNRVNVAA